MTMETGKMTQDCPICGADILNNGLMMNELLPCPECGSDLEVIGLIPLKLEKAPEEKEDWGE
jgi:alpha-aminoadipate carrier protein LysW